MDVGLLEAISKLWLVLLVLLMTVCVVLFRDEIRGVLRRFSKLSVRRGETHVELEQALIVDPQPGEQEVEDQPRPSASAPTRATARVEATEEVNPSMFELIIQGELEKAEAQYKIERDALDDLNQRRNLEGFYLALRFTNAGDPGALEELNRLSASDDGGIYHWWLGYCYHHIGEFAHADTAYVTAAELADNSVERPSGGLQQRDHVGSRPLLRTRLLFFGGGYLTWTTTRPGARFIRG